MEKNRIVWMMDETIAESDPKDWGRLKSLYADLIGIIGKEGFHHGIADPIPAFHTLAQKLSQEEGFSTIIDLSGWSGAFLQTLFPEAKIVSDLGMSRVRDVSSPELYTTGHILNHTPDRVEEIKRTCDLSDVLIFDDTTVTGGTGMKTARILGPERVTHAYLIANTGSDENSAVNRIQRRGQKVLYGSEIDFPREDGWHLKDLHQFDNLKDAFYASLRLQDIYLDRSNGSVEQFLKDEENLDLIFPKRLTSAEVIDLHNQGRFILNNGRLPSNGTSHVVNPVLWASQYLMEHVDAQKVIREKDRVYGLLEEIQSIMSSNDTTKKEVGQVLSDIACRYRGVMP
ncbi:MAG: hypothetical protein ABIJ21_01465 [Nanoarchaeota archaeon]